MWQSVALAMLSNAWPCPLNAPSLPLDLWIRIVSLKWKYFYYTTISTSSSDSNTTIHRYIAYSCLSFLPHQCLEAAVLCAVYIAIAVHSSSPCSWLAFSIVLVVIQAWLWLSRDSSPSPLYIDWEACLEAVFFELVKADWQCTLSKSTSFLVTLCVHMQLNNLYCLFLLLGRLHESVEVTDLE